MKALILILTLGFSTVVFGMAPDLAAAAALNSANSSAQNITDFRSAEDANNTRQNSFTAEV